MKLKDKAHKLILQSFLYIKFPSALKECNHYNDFILLDSFVAGYCEQLLHSKDQVIKFDFPLISRDAKDMFSNIINKQHVECKDEIVLYYKLLTLVEIVLNYYNDSFKIN